MSRRRKKTRGKQRLQVVTLCISTSLVLVLLGMVVFSVLTANNLSAYVKENLTVTVMLGDNTTVNQAHLLCRDLYHRPYSRNIDYISKEQAQREQSEAMGSDPSEFLGFNPFVATLEIQLKSDYVSRDSMKWIAKELRANPKVIDVAYQEDLMDKVNDNLRKVNLILLALAVLLTCVSFSLSNNTVRLSVYSRRFIIHTMKLVGAEWSFIRRPFLRRAFFIGLVAVLIADGLLGGSLYYLQFMAGEGEVYLNDLITPEVWAATLGIVAVCGLVLTVWCAYLSVNRHLRSDESDVYLK